jgi:HD-like signal output (HDOD) protein
VPAPPSAPAPPPHRETQETPEPPTAQEPIGQLLIGAGLITEEQLQDALSKQQRDGGKTFEILLALGYLDKDQLHAFLSRQPGIAAIDLSRCNISQDLIKLVPKKLAIENLVLPIDQLGKLLTVAMACPLDVGTIGLLERATGLKVKAMLCKLEDIHTAVQKYYPERKQFDLTPSAFDNLPGASAPKDKVEEKLKKWNGMLLSAELIKSLSEKIAPEEVSLDLVAALALNEPTFGATLMRFANSELYGMRGQVDSIPMAVAVLGKPAIERILATCLEPADPKGLAIVTPWMELCRRTGQIAQALARETQVMGPHAAYSLGLVGELGRIALAMVSPLQYKRVKVQLYGEQLVQAEQRLFTMSHSEAAAFVATEWHYPAPMARAMQFYLSPADAQESRRVACLLNLASGLANMNGADVEKQMAAYGASIEELGITPETLLRIAATKA